jgi:chitodextrinase
MNHFLPPNPPYTDKEHARVHEREVVQSLNVDSLFRKQYMTSNANEFTIEFPTSIKNVIRMKLSSVELPNTWYAFTDKNNTFEIGISYDNSDVSTNTIAIPEGNYSSLDFSEQLNTYLNNQPANTYLEHLMFEVDEFSSKGRFRFKTYDEAQNIYNIPSVMNDNTITNDATYQSVILTKIRYSLKFALNTQICNDTQMYESVGWTLGYRKTEYDFIDYFSSMTKWNTTYHGVVEAEGVFGSNKLNYLYLSVDDYVNKSKEGVLTINNSRTHLSKNILARITVKYGSFYVNLDGDDDVVRHRDYYGPVTIEKLHVKLLDKYGNLVNLNGSDFSFILEFTQSR